MLVHGDDFKELISEYLPASLIEEEVSDTKSEEKSDKEEHHGSGQKLGEMLVAKGVITQVDLMKALASSKRKNVPIGSTLFEMGLISLDQLKEVLHNQSGYNIVTADQLANQKDFVNILPEDFIKANSVIPVSSDGKTLTVGVVKPIEQDVVKAIIYMTGLNPKQLLMTHYEFSQAVNTFFSESKRQTDEIISQITSEGDDGTAEEDAQAQIKRELEDSTGSVAKFVNQIITNGIDSKASDIHIEPRLSGYIVRYRKDGMLSKVLDVPARVESAIIARFKVMARMNIAENRRPQDGTFSISYKNIS
jgi:type IV pilus assembly protein PilB